MKVLVTDGDNRAALAVTRSLGRAGHEVVVAARQSSALAQASRYCSERFVYPNPVDDPGGFVEAIVELVRRRGINCIIPIADITTFLVTANRDRFEPECRVPFADAATIERAADKVDIIRTAQRVGVPVPASVIVESADEIASHELTFPLVIKPWRSRIPTAAGWASTSVSFAADLESLRHDLASRAAHEFPVMLQERIEGPGVGVFACYRGGRPVAMFSHRRLRERPPWGGVSVLCESIDLPPSTRQFAVALLDAIEWHGVAMVEFKVDRRDNLPKLMEVNGRFWGSLQLAIDAGVDFPAILVDEAAPQQPYRVGVRNRWLWGDFDSLLQTIRWIGPEDMRPSRRRALRQFLQFAGPTLHYDNPKWDDPWPFAVETRHRVANLVEFLGRNRPRAIKGATASRPKQPGLVTRAVTRLDAAGLDQQAWNALAASAATHSVFQTHQWMRSWLDVYGDGGEPLLLAAEEDGRTTGVAPLMLLPGAGPRQRIATFIGAGRADYCDFIVSKASRGALRALIDGLLDHPEWDTIDLGNVPSHSATAGALRAACRERGLLFTMREQYCCPTLLLQGNGHEGTAVVDKASLRRCQRRFERAGVLVARDMVSAEQIVPHLTPFFEQHVARWRDTNTPSLFVDDRSRQFYHALTNAFDGSGWLLFSSIELNGQSAAYHYGFDYNGSVLWYKPSFDPNFAALSPGNVMIKHLIDYAVRERRRELDFTVGDEPFKRRFTNFTRTTLQLKVYRNTMAWLRSAGQDVTNAATRTVLG